MFNLNNLLCLNSERTPRSVMEQALHLGTLFDANSHVVSTPEAIPDVENKIRQFVESEAVHQPVTGRTSIASAADFSSIDDVKEYVREYDIDLVVASTPGDRGAVPVMAAENTKVLVNEVECSLLIVNPDSDIRTCNRIVVPTDFSKDARSALDGALAFAGLFDAEIDLLHVIETVPYVALTRVDRLSMSGISFPEHRAHRQLKHFLGTVPETDIPINTHLEYGDPGDQINHFLNRHGTDLMVMSLPVPCERRGHLGPTSDRILRRATCPLLLLRP